ncbi:MAG: hypothetical protein PVI90_00415 [Desulfobacteraceae bacterium]|jgi:hypothetical protein
MRFICTLFVLMLGAVCIGSCGFATDSIPGDTTVIEGPTKYKKLVVGPCSFKISVETAIPIEWSHWKENLQQFAVMSQHTKPLERARYSMWDDLYTHVSCGFCTQGLHGLISVLDSKDHLVPWGCGVERPPLDIQQVTATYSSVKDEEDTAWEDMSLLTYTHAFTPEILLDDRFCEGDPVVLDLTEACEVLVAAGLVERID